MSADPSEEKIEHIAGAPAQATERSKATAESFLKESDRGCAIFGAALLHDDLELLLRAFFRDDPRIVRSVVSPLFQTYAPLATFSARIQLSFAMRLIPVDLKEKLDVVRRLRNDFAHASGPIDFKDERCCDRLALLIGREPTPGTSKDGEPSDEGPSRITNRPELVARLAFVFSIVRLSGTLEFLTKAITEGRDIRQIVAAMERETSK